jgi:hypothetical protein
MFTKEKGEARLQNIERRRTVSYTRSGRVETLHHEESQNREM